MADRGRGRGNRGRGRGGDRGGAPRGGGPPGDPGAGRGARGGGDRGAPRGGGDRGGGRGGDRGRGGFDRGGFGDRGRGGGDRGRGRGQGPPPPIGGGAFQPPPVYPSNASSISPLVRAIGIKRPAFGTLGTTVALYTNNFESNIPRGTIYQYDIVIMPEKALPPEVNMRIIRTMQEENAAIFDPKGVYDGKKIFYAPAELPFGERQEFQVDLNERGQFKVRITKAATINPETLMRYIQGQMSHDESVLTTINACNVAIRMEPIQNNPFNVRSFFTRDEFRHLGRGIELWRGYFQSVRPGIGKMVVNLDISTGTFYKSGPLIGLCMEFLGYGPDANPESQLGGKMDPRRKSDLLKFIRNLKVRTQRRGEAARVRPIKDLSRVSALEDRFNLQDGSTTTISAFFSQQGVRLRYPNLLSVKLSSKAFVPIELCTVVEGQAMRKPIPSDLVKGVLDFSTSRPEQRLRSIRNGLQVLQYGNSSYLQDFGIEVSPNPMLIQGRVLPTPTLQYKGSEIRPANGMWNMRGRRLWDPAEIKGCVVLNYDPRFNYNAQIGLVDGLMEACRDLGILGMTRDVPVLRKDATGSTYANHIREAAALYRKEAGGMPNLVIVVLPDRGNEDIYVRIKHAGDVVIGVATQCVKGSKLARANLQYWANVCLKINVKLGGINVVPKANTVEFLTDPTNPTLVIGADVMHPHPGPSYKSRPSFAAVIGNVDSTTSRYIATSRPQKSGQEEIEELEDMVHHILTRYMAYRQQVEKKKILAPRRVLFYRDGVSEGQFAMVVNKEVAQIRAAFVKAKIPRPTLTVVVVGKRHHNRFFPANAKDADRSGNAPAGTVIDREITNPVEFDFFLQSHGGLLGTSRSAHYSCLVDENNFTADSLQHLSFSLCHLYARATRSVSIVSPTYYADIVCARAKHHYDPDSHLDLSDTASLLSAEAAEAQQNQFKEGFKPLHAGTAQNMYFQ